MKRYICIIICILLGSYSYAQIATLGPHQDVDSLRGLILSDIDDSNKVYHLNALGRELSNSNTDSAKYLAGMALQLAELIHFPRGIAYSQLVIGWCENVQGNYPKAIFHLQKAASAEKEIGQDVIVSAALSVMGNVYDNDKDPEHALFYYFKALEMDKAANNVWGISRNTGLAGYAYAQQKNYTKALSQYYRALAMTDELGNINGSAVWIGYIGDVYKIQGMDTKAIECYSKALNVFEELDNKWKVAELLGNIGAILIRQNRYLESCNYLYRSLHLSQTIAAQNTTANTFEALSMLFEQSTVPLPDTVSGKVLSLNESRIRSFFYYKQFIALRDSLFSNARARHLLRLEFEQKQIAATVIQQQKSHLEKLETKKYRIITIALFANSAVLLLLVFYIIKQSKLRRSLEREQLLSRLSRDLHDDIGSTLSSINILSRTAQNNLDISRDEKIKATLEKIHERSQRLLNSMSDIIWNMKPGNDSIEEVLSRMRSYATSILEANNIDYSVDFPKEVIENRLSMEMKNNIYLIFKEAVNNLSKYSNCTKASLNLIFENNAIFLQIVDDGIGFDMQKVKSHGGLNNMRQRTEEMNGKIIIKSAPGRGTSIEIYLKISD